jgi:hypothetical protein
VGNNVYIVVDVFLCNVSLSKFIMAVTNINEYVYIMFWCYDLYRSLSSIIIVVVKVVIIEEGRYQVRSAV